MSIVRERQTGSLPYIGRWHRENGFGRLRSYGSAIDESGELHLEVIIYTKPGCPYCEKAREHYNAQKIAFEDRNAQDNPAYRKQMLSITGGDPTVPAIVENGVLKQSGWEGRG